MHQMNLRKSIAVSWSSYHEILLFYFFFKLKDALITHNVATYRDPFTKRHTEEGTIYSLFYPSVVKKK